MKLANRIRVAIVGAILLLGGSLSGLAAAEQSVETMIGCDLTGTIYDVDRITGAATNPRNTQIMPLAGIAVSESGVLFALTTGASSLYRIDKTTGDASLIGATGVWIIEGDLAFDPTSGKLYALFEEIQFPRYGKNLLEIDPTTGAAELVGTIPESGDYSAMAFHSDGRMFVLDAENTELLEIDPTTATILSSIGLSYWLNRTAGMAFDPVSEVFYVVPGNANGISPLYTLDIDTGVLTAVGLLGVPDGMTGLSIRNTVVFKDDFESGNTSAWSSVRYSPEGRTESFQADRHPRKRGPRPLNSPR